MILWPCVLTMPEGTIQGATKVYYVPGSVDVWGWDDETQKAVVLVHGEVLTEVEHNAYEIETADGTFRVVVDPHACGCGHPLRYFRPAAPVR